MNDVEFVETLISNGFEYFDCVPCSNLKGIIAQLSLRKDIFINFSNNEGESLSNAFAASLLGKKSVVLLQNSGLGNLINPLTSLVKLYDTKILYVIGYRGFDESDELQHQFMGLKTKGLLENLNLTYQELDKNDSVLDLSKDCLLIKRGIIKDTLVESASREKRLLNYETAIRGILELIDNRYFCFSTTGYISRMLFKINDSPRNFYNIGAMGCTSAIAKTYNKLKNVPTVIFDGDGAFLMRLENNIMDQALQNKYIYVLLNNGSYNSTGAQKTNINFLDLNLLSHGLGFDLYLEIKSQEDFEKLHESLTNEDFTKVFVNCEINNYHQDLPRIKRENVENWLNSG